MPQRTTPGNRRAHVDRELIPDTLYADWFYIVDAFALKAGYLLFDPTVDRWGRILKIEGEVASIRWADQRSKEQFDQNIHLHDLQQLDLRWGLEE